jgi:methionyl-tRNA formyltransferase
MRLVFMGTPDFAVPILDSLAHRGHEIAAVYTQPDRPAGRGRGIALSPVKKKALEDGLVVRQPVSLRQLEEVQTLAGLRPDVVVVAAYGKLLPQSVLDIPRFGCLNVHPSLLPRHRGPSPVAGAILAGDEVTGVSIMLLDEGMDTGPVLTQEKVPVSPQDTTGSLTAKLSEIGARLLTQTLPLWTEGKILPRPQENEEATYSKAITKESGRIDWQLPALDIWRQVRAFQPWPGCGTTWKGRLLKIIEAVPLPGVGEAGMVSAIKGSQSAAPIGVQTGDGILGLLHVQMEGKRVMPAEDFLRGQADFLGAVLPS